VKIFVTLGFENFSFDRLIRAIDNGARDGRISGDILIQTGYSLYPVRFCETKRFMRFDEIMSCFKNADIVVSHAGVGTTLLCLGLGKIPVIFPRRVKYREHVDDHQVQFAKMLEKRKKVLVAYDDDKLLTKISGYGPLVEKLLVDRTDAPSSSLKLFMDELLGQAPVQKEIVP